MLGVRPRAVLRREGSSGGFQRIELMMVVVLSGRLLVEGEGGRAGPGLKVLVVL